jgi:hypothetical protein
MSSDSESPLKDLKPVDANKFRIQNRQLHLTYSGHLDPNAFLTWIGSICPVEKYSIVHETGDTLYPHTHALIRFVKNFQSTNCRIFDFNSIHPHIKRVSTPSHWNNCISYHTKQGVPFTNIFPPTDTPSIVSQIWSSNSPSDAILNHCTKPGEANGIVTIFTMKPIDYGPEPEIDWYPWQKELLDQISTPCTDDRRVIWYYDPIGDHGKTFMSKHLAKYYDAFITTKANSYHISTMIQKLIQANRPPALVVFNFTRQQEEHRVYECIESVKDGLITAQKYLGQTLVFDSPHVVVFSNYLPAVEMMSSDRWDIRLLKNKLSFPLSVDLVNTINHLPEHIDRDSYALNSVSNSSQPKLHISTPVALQVPKPPLITIHPKLVTTPKPIPPPSIPIISNISSSTVLPLRNHPPRRVKATPIAPRNSLKF